VTSSGPLTVIVLMGVAGSGKTTVGRELAAELGWEFLDGDNFHPAANVAKMAAGVPLDDADRAPWLAAVRDEIARRLAGGRPAVFACSALKERYRRELGLGSDRVKLVFLHGEYSLILDRLRHRQGHFMKESLLRSQFEALEIPAQALTVDVRQGPPEIAAQIRRECGL
jgi:gluconokinase